MVYIHGDDYLSGGLDDYPPLPLLNHPVVLVVLQYRLGVLGKSVEGRKRGTARDVRNQALFRRQFSFRSEIGTDFHWFLMYGNKIGFTCYLVLISGTDVRLKLYLPTRDDLIILEKSIHMGLNKISREDFLTHMDRFYYYIMDLVLPLLDFQY